MATIVIPPSGGGGGITQIDTGNTLWVDAVFGNDGTALPDRQDKPYLTISAAIAAAGAGDIVMLRPGTYAETVIMASDVSVRGVSREVCTLEPPDGAATVVEMAANCSLEEVTLSANASVSRFALSFPGTTSASSYARNVRITGGGGGNVTGVIIVGSGASPANWVTLDHVDVISSLVAYGLVSSTTGNFLARDCIFDGVLGANIGSTGPVTLQDCRISGSFASLVVVAGATCRVNQGTRWEGSTGFAGTLVRDGDFLDTSIYDNDGTLSGARTVNMNSLSLGFTNAGAGIGIGTATANGSAILDLTSTALGLLLPRMTTAQMTAIASPAEGLLVWDTTTNDLKGYDGANWCYLGGKLEQVYGIYNYNLTADIDNLGSTFAADYAKTNIIRITPDANNWEISGIVAPAAGINRVIHISNVSNTLDIKFKDDNSGTAANGMLLRDSADKSIKGNETASFWYDHVVSRWKVFNRVG